MFSTMYQKMTRLLPTAKGLMKFPYFNMFVVDMKAWQLYVGQTIWVIAIGLLFYLMTMLIESTSLSKVPGLKKSVDVTKKLATGEGIDSSFGSELLA